MIRTYVDSKCSRKNPSFQSKLLWQLGSRELLQSISGLLEKARNPFVFYPHKFGAIDTANFCPLSYLPVNNCVLLLCGTGRDGTRRDR